MKIKSSTLVALAFISTIITSAITGVGFVYLIIKGHPLAGAFFLWISAVMGHDYSVKIKGTDSLEDEE